MVLIWRRWNIHIIVSQAKMWFTSEHMLFTFDEKKVSFILINLSSTSLHFSKEYLFAIHWTFFLKWQIFIFYQWDSPQSLLFFYIWVHTDLLVQRFLLLCAQFMSSAESCKCKVRFQKLHSPDWMLRTVVHSPVIFLWTGNIWGKYWTIPILANMK